MCSYAVPSCLLPHCCLQSNWKSADVYTKALDDFECSYGNDNLSTFVKLAHQVRKYSLAHTPQVGELLAAECVAYQELVVCHLVMPIMSCNTSIACYITPGWDCVTYNACCVQYALTDNTFTYTCVHHHPTVLIQSRHASFGISFDD